MIGAGTVIAQRLTGVATHEDGPGMTDLGQHRVRIGHRQFQVFRGNKVTNLGRLVQIAAQDQPAARGDRGADDGLARHRRHQFGDAGLHRVEEGRVRGDEDGLRQLIVLGLGKQVHGDPVRVGLAVTDNQDLGRPGNHVDADGPKHTALGLGHIGITRADDLVHLRHGRRAIGQRGHGLGTANAKHTIHARHGRCRQHQFVLNAVRGRHHHDQFLDASHLRRDGVHQHGRGIGRLAARHIKADTIQRRDLLAQHRAVGLGVGPGMLQLPFMVATHAVSRGVQGRAQIGRKAVKRCLQTRLGQLQLGHRGHIKAIEPCGVLQHGRIAALTHGADDGLYRVRNRLIGIGGEGQQRGQLRLEIRTF